MQLLQHCTNCRTPFTLRDDELLQALAFMKENNHKYYNANCPSCGKPNKISGALIRKSAPKSGNQPSKSAAGAKKSK